MQQLLWHLRVLRRYIGWSSLLATVLLLTSSVVYLERVLPREAEIVRLDEEINRIQRADSGSSTDEKLLSPSEQIAAFYAFFPADNAQSDVLDRIFAAATKENLALPQGEYQWSRERTGLMIRYGITLPIKGPYPSMRRFMAQALKENPSLSLDSVNFGRQTVSDIGVDAQVHFTLYLRGDAS